MQCLTNKTNKLQKSAGIFVSFLQNSVLCFAHHLLSFDRTLSKVKDNERGSTLDTCAAPSSGLNLSASLISLTATFQVFTLTASSDCGHTASTVAPFTGDVGSLELTSVQHHNDNSPEFWCHKHCKGQATHLLTKALID